jgi:hypothetical protein
MASAGRTLAWRGGYFQFDPWSLQVSLAFFTLQLSGAAHFLRDKRLGKVTVGA